MPAFQDPDIYRAILDELQIGVCVLDLQKKIVFWSDGAEQITGYARIDVLGHLCTDNILLHCNQTQCEMCNEMCPLAMALHSSRPVEAVSFIHHKSGHQTPVHTWAIPLRDKHGAMIGIIQTFEEEFSVNGPDPSDRSLKDRGWLDNETGLPNQAMMQSHLKESLGTFAEVKIPFGVVCLEVHELGQLRGHYGREAEKLILKVLARTLRNTVWPTDYVGRWGDNRFLVILSGCGEDALQAVAGRILRMMSSASIMWWGEELSVTVSLGRTEAIIGDTVETIVQRAQQPLGGNRIALSASNTLAASASSAKGSSS